MTQPGPNGLDVGSGSILFEAMAYDPATVLLVVVGGLALLATSGWVVSMALQHAGVDTTSSETRDTGTVIGKTENVLVFTLMLLQAYTALGVIFAAKSIVRRGDMDRENTAYYLTGTLVNFTYSILVSVAIHGLLWAVIAYDLFGLV